MTQSRETVKRNLLNAIKALALEGNLLDWLAVMFMFAIPFIAVMNVAELIHSVFLSLVVPLVFHPISQAIGISNLESLVIGGLGIGRLFCQVVEFCFVMLTLFWLTRLLRRVI